MFEIFLKKLPNQKKTSFKYLDILKFKESKPCLIVRLFKNSGLYAKLLILLTYVSSVLIIAYSYYEIFNVTIRQSKKKRALNSSNLRLYDDSHDHFEPKAARRTPRERKRNHKKGQNVSNLPSRSASLRSIASMTSFTMKNLATGNIDIQRTRKKGLKYY